MSSSLPVRLFCLSAVLSLTVAHGAHAQSAGAPAKAQHPAVCAKGVRVYTDLSQAPTPHDTLSMPPAPGPVRVTSEAEAEAAELAMRGRAGSVGATGVIVTDREVEENGNVRLTRQVTAIFAPADSARSQQACK